ncbi:hypothetical protein TSOC_006974 [Tetrabaena socialis]|uniref:Uncharacterized protein n=1 Tax=Tetrabaena socialis TaxID=47790 RepID=A0A2J8A276_9CHLO|nr:hypothetical protein TSOC_006974 [Tetrabaena socialis]|eukprot:PNH06631.1 hypothetical protein TSOC_006974 [Tetrabaena socialis]
MAATLKSTVSALGPVSAVRRPITRLVLAKALPSKCGSKTFDSAPSFISGLAVAAPLLVAASARAEEAAGPVVEAAEAAEAVAVASAGPGGGEAALLITPVLLYVAFTVYRDRVNPKATFLDYVYILATVAIVANLISIVAFNTRFF